MAIHKSTNTGVYVDNHQEFICDKRSDIALLPTQTKGKDRCPTGSKAFVIDDSSRWILNSEGVWKEIFTTSSSSGGSSVVDEINVATDSEVDSMLNDVFSN